MDFIFGKVLPLVSRILETFQPAMLKFLLALNAPYEQAVRNAYGTFAGGYFARPAA